MPLRSLFRRKPANVAPSDDASSGPSVDFINVPAAGPSIHNGTSVYPSLSPTPTPSRLRLPFARHRQVTTSSSASVACYPTNTPRTSSGAFSDADSLDLRPPSKANFLRAYGDHQGPLSTRSLPNQRTSTPSQDTPKKSSSKFFWSKSRSPQTDQLSSHQPPQSIDSRSSTSPISPQEEDTSSFNLKSFRHVRPPSPSRANFSSSSLVAPRPPIRPRGDSIASDASQRISVAAFREAQARRSLSSSPVPSFRDTHPRNSPVPPPKAFSGASTTKSPPNQPPRQHRPSRIPSSSAIDDSESESESCSDGDSEDDRPLTRRRTITQRSSSSKIVPKNDKKARSELGHNSPFLTSSRNTSNAIKSRSPQENSPTDSRPVSSASKSRLGMSPSIRSRASASTGALTQTSVPKRAGGLVSAQSSHGSHANIAQNRQSSAPTKSVYSDSNSDSDDDAPLSSLVAPRFGGSTTSLSSPRSTPSLPKKPLVDIEAVTKFRPGSNLPDVNASRGRNGGVTSTRPPVPQKFVSPETSPVRKEAPLVESPTTMEAAEQAASRETAFREAVSDRLSKVVKQKFEEQPDPVEKPRLRHRRSHSDHGSSTPSRSSTMDQISTMNRSSNISSALSSDGIHGPIPPVHIKTRLPPSSFSVLSRPQHSKSLPIAENSPSTRPRSSTLNNPAAAPPKEPPHPLPSRETTKPNKTISPPPARPRSTSMVQLQLPPSPRQSFQRPSKPFADSWTDSPASSVGGSSSGRAPVTPRDGSDLSVGPLRDEQEGDRKEWSGGASGISVANPRKGHVKRRSVGFEDEIRGRHPTPPNDTQNEEARRRERRKSEAKAAIELGNVINGRGPVLDDDDEDIPINQIVGPRMSMAGSMVGMPGNLPSNMTSPNTPMSWNGVPMWQTPSQFMSPPDPNFMVAHQQAMMIAKQAYQMAVAQQAIAAAGEEWERSSSIGGYGGGGSVYGGSTMSVGNWQRNSFLFPGSQSVYGGSGARTEYGGGARSEYGGGWGSRSVYGDNFGPSSANRGSPGRPSMGQRVESGYFTGASIPPVPQNAPGARSSARLRAESGPALRPNGRKAPPSSWKASGL